MFSLILSTVSMVILFYFGKKLKFVECQIWAVVEADIPEWYVIFFYNNTTWDLKNLLGHWEYNGHTVHKLTQWCFTVNWVIPCGSFFSHICNKVPFNFLPNYIKVVKLIIEIFKMFGYILRRNLHMNLIYYKTKRMDLIMY